MLDAIRAYNAEDCVVDARAARLAPGPDEARGRGAAGLRLRRARGALPAKEFVPSDWMVRMQALAEELAAGLPADDAQDDADAAERRLLSHLMLFHRREAKPEWWRYFELRDMTAEQLIDERDAIGDLALDRRVAPVPVKRSTDWTFAFPPQELKLDSGPLRRPGHRPARQRPAHRATTTWSSAARPRTARRRSAR